MSHACPRYPLLLVALGIAACGSNDNRPAMVEVSVVPDGSAEGNGGTGGARLDSSLAGPDVPDAARESSDGQATPVDVVIEPSEEPTPPPDAPHVSPPSDAPVETDPRDVRDAGCAPGCDVGCLTVHDNGVGGTFTDCMPLGTYDATQAARAAGSAANVPGDLMGSLMCGFGPNTSMAVCKVGPTNCACWTYAATGTFVPRIGHTTNNTVIANCLCPTTLDPVWN